MSILQGVLQRLALVRYMMDLASEQVRVPEPFSAVALLQIHDSVELWFAAAADHLNLATKSDTGFLSFLDLIGAAIAPTELAHREPIRRMNKARVALKHHSTRPAQDELDDFYYRSRAFLEENSSKVFDTSLEDVSLAQLVEAEEVRVHLLEADKYINEHNYQAARNSITESFARLLIRYDIPEPRSAWRIDLAAHSDYRSLHAKDLRTLEGKVRHLEEAASKLESELALLGYGIDIRRARLFRALTPYIAVAMSGVSQIVDNPNHAHRQVTPEQVRFCYSFVFDSALKLQRTEGLRDRLAGK